MSIGKLIKPLSKDIGDFEVRRAAKKWEEGGFDRVEGDPEFIPLPENRL